MLAVGLALAASLCWGSGDFLGGLTTRRATLWAVVVGSQAIGLAGAVLVVLVTGRPWIGMSGLWPVLLGGVAGSVALMAFYKALAIGTMSVVAPITATSALIPFLWGIGSGERPSELQLAGVALAVAGVLLVTVERPRRGKRVGVGVVPGEPAIEPPDPGPRGSEDGSPGSTTGGTPVSVPDRAVQRRAVLLALVAAVGIGLMLLGYDETAKHDALWALLGGRISSACFFTVFLLALRPRIGMRRSALPGIVAVGILDTSANGLFALATTQGFLSLVAVLGSLYPVVTVVLAYLVLRERLARHQVIGVVGALVGVALIAAR
jgi:drug/metabolite transporter (DMT)-like permease